MERKTLATVLEWISEEARMKVAEIRKARNGQLPAGIIRQHPPQLYHTSPPSHTLTPSKLVVCPVTLVEDRQFPVAFTLDLSTFVETISPNPKLGE